MTIEDLQKQLEEFARQRDWEQFHTPKNLAMALASEAGELVSIFQWLTPDESLNLDDRQRENLTDELADVATYLFRLAAVANIDLVEAVAHKIVANERRYPADRVRGSARKYTEFGGDD